MIDLNQIKENVIKGEVDEVKKLVQQALDEGQNAKRILDEALLSGIKIVGDKYESGEFFLPEMVIAASAMKEGLKILSPLLKQEEMAATGKGVLGTAKGDIHDIGKTIVGTMMEGAGFIITDLGVDVPQEKFVRAAKENNADIVGISALLTTTMMGMKDVIQAIRKAGLKTKVMVGGASVTQEFADSIGADGYAPDAPSAVQKAKQLLGS